MTTTSAETDGGYHYWQPVMLVTKRRVECACGAAAIFVVLDDDGPDDFGYAGWCHDCWEREQDDDG